MGRDVEVWIISFDRAAQDGTGALPLGCPSVIPSRYALAVRRRIEGAKDGHGNSVQQWGDPIAWMVRQVDPGASVRPFEQGRDLSMVLFTVHSDAGPNVPTEFDLVVVDGVEYAVQGRPSDWTRGPFPNPAAGVVTFLKAVSG